ncbi:hypothetical protein HDU78_011077 [Chytriomyces hyalinus]|nr:hypothetical protein HDU78_011077 [Chytriomyces hyalinus]
MAVNEWYQSEGLPQVYLNTAKGLVECWSFGFREIGQRVLRDTSEFVSWNGEEMNEGYAVSYIQQDGTKKTVYAKDGWNLLDLAHSNNIELEGACEGSLACSTCHIVMQKEFYEKLEEPSDEENDMLDLAFGLTETSRLGCQVEMSKDLDGMTVRIPSASRNIKQEKM